MAPTPDDPANGIGLTMSSTATPSQIRPMPRPFPGTWLVLFLGVLSAGCSLGGFLMLSARTEANAPYLADLGNQWVRVSACIPVLGNPFKYWNEVAQSQQALLFPGLVVGGLGGVILWWYLAMGAAWQNSILFPRALRRIAWCLLPLLLYLPLAGMTGHGGSWWWHLFTVIPFAFSTFLLAWQYRRIRCEALGGVHYMNRQGGEGTPLAEPLVWIVSFAAFFFWASFSLLRHTHFHSQAYNMALIGHALSRFVMGQGMNSSLSFVQDGPLTYPFSPILYLIAPLYYFGPHPETLLLLQAAAVAFASVPLFLFARQYLGNPWAACAMAICYLFLPGLSEGIYSDFDPLSLAPFLFFWFAWESIRPGSRRWWVPLALVWLISASLFLYTLAWGLFLLVHGLLGRSPSRLQGSSTPHSSNGDRTPSPPSSRSIHLLTPALVIVLSLLYPAIVYGFLQPRLFPEAQAEIHFVSRYKDFIPEWMEPSSQGIPGLIREIAGNPLIALSLLFDPQRLEVFMRFWGGVMFLPLWNPLAWFPLAAAIENSLSSEGLLFTWGGVYGYTPAMVTALAMVISLALLRKWRISCGWVTPLSWVVLFSSVTWWIGDSTTRTADPPPWVRYAALMAPEGTVGILSSQIPLGKSVSSQSHLLPHLVHEANLYLLPPSKMVSVVGAPEESPEFERFQPASGWPDYLILDRESTSFQAWYNLWYYERTKLLSWLDWLIQSGRYRKVLEHGTLEIYEKAGIQP
jgi:hypothetical protein